MIDGFRPSMNRRSPPTKYILASLALVGVALGASAHPPDLDAEIAVLDHLIKEATANPYATGSVAWTLAEAERRTLALARASLLAQRAGAPDPRPERPAPDPERAAEILRAIADAEGEVQDAEREAEAAAPLVRALALLTAATAKLTAAQLRLAWYETHFGLPIALPPASAANDRPGASAWATPPQPEPPPEWADPEHPEIDYSKEPFRSWGRIGGHFAGWWTIHESMSPIDDSREVYAMNLSATRETEPSLIARCRERRLEFIYQPGTYLITEDGTDNDTFRLITRLDDTPARTEYWSASTNNKAVFHRRPRQALQDLILADKLFLRLHERREQHDATFRLAGAFRALSEVATACSIRLESRDEHEKRTARAQAEDEARRKRAREAHLAKEKTQRERAKAIPAAPAAWLDTTNRQAPSGGWRIAQIGRLIKAQSAHSETAQPPLKATVRVWCPPVWYPGVAPHALIDLWGDKPLYPPTAANASINVHWDAPTVPAEAIPASLRVNTVTIAPAATASFVRALRTREAAWIVLPGLPDETLVFPVGLSGSNVAIGEALAKCTAQAERQLSETQRKKDEETPRKIEPERHAQEEATARENERLEKERLALLRVERLEYIAQIRDKIERNWIHPPGVAPGLEANVRVVQIPSGEVVQVEIVTSSGNVAFDRSIEEAALRSSPLPLPKDPSLFDRSIMIAFELEA